MDELAEEVLRIIRDLSEKQASGSLPRVFAKLYSQHTKIRTNQPGLATWSQQEASERFDDAIRILDVGLFKKENGQNDWQEDLRRGGELFEWLSLPALNPYPISARLLASALYQIAGYPALAYGLLDQTPATVNEKGIPESLILQYFLKADFNKLFAYLSQFWPVKYSLKVETTLNWENSESFEEQLWEILTNEMVGAMGILCTFIRWGDRSRLSRAIDKLLAINQFSLNGDNAYSWLLARLCYETAQIYVANALRQHVIVLTSDVSQNGKIAFERYLRQSIKNGRSFVWPSQAKGIKRIAEGGSFALCTPTGSGKTSVAELAIIHSMFGNPKLQDVITSEGNTPKAPLAVYLVPSRALAAEVEAKLSRVFKNLGEERVIVVTGLYGGIDWGPTDAWLNSNERTVLICTYEKAEALIRFLGPLFVERISLVIIDEAHSIQFSGKLENLQTGDDRSLRLEVLAMRLLDFLSLNKGRAIALSAVATGGGQALAQWITGSSSSTPENINYRSTRQLIGRLECKANRGFEIYYDLLDGHDLHFEADDEPTTPYILDPFPPYPTIKNPKTGVEARLRPYLLWAAMNLAASDMAGKKHTVLISITQGIGGYAKDFLCYLENEWSDTQLPKYFEEPSEPTKMDLWQKCLSSCRDYFTEDSNEYRLLKKGIVVHHGKMPGLMARLLVRAVQEQIVFIVVATSTLSEGVNLPFETILVPTLRRISGHLDTREFGNLSGRAGRPGIGTEGRTLVLLPREPLPSDNLKDIGKIRRSRFAYQSLINEIGNEINYGSMPRTVDSPLATLIIHLRDAWSQITNSSSDDDFFDWLEKTAPLLEPEEKLNDEVQRAAIESLDSLDEILLSSIVEFEHSKNDDKRGELESKLKDIWQRSFAKYASSEEARLEKFFIKRGKSLQETVYRDPVQRLRLYCTGLPPRDGNQMLTSSQEIFTHLKTGFNFSEWDREKRFDYIWEATRLVSELSKFKLFKPRGMKALPDQILHWWLDPVECESKPAKEKISEWYDFISVNYLYRFNWGFGSVIALVINEVHDGKLESIRLEEWGKTGLPWVALWLKDLITWGTLDPVVAYLLSQGMEYTRPDAEKAAKFYYQDQADIDSPDNMLDPRLIRDWAAKSLSANHMKSSRMPPGAISATLKRNFEGVESKTWRVLPVKKENEIHWFDPAGHLLAISIIPDEWKLDFFDDYDFILDTRVSQVIVSPYLEFNG